MEDREMTERHWDNFWFPSQNRPQKMETIDYDFPRGISYRTVFSRFSTAFYCQNGALISAIL